MSVTRNSAGVVLGWRTYMMDAMGNVVGAVSTIDLGEGTTVAVVNGV